MSKQANFSRKITLESPDRKPSVFERLGTKSSSIPGKNICRNWLQNGTCPLNKQCKLAHTHTLINPIKKSKLEAMKKSGVVHKKLKEDCKKSVKSHHSDLEWEGWELCDLEDADEKVLEKRKQELQRELQLQLKKEKKLKKERRDEKKRAASSSSSSTTTTESTSSSSSSSSSSSEPKKRSNRKRKLSSSSSDSEKSSHRKKKSPKISKSKVASVRKPMEKKDIQTITEIKSKSVIVSKKPSVQKKSYSPHWEKSSKKSLTKQQNKKTSPHHSPDSKNKSCSPKCEKTITKNKSRRYSPMSKSKESSQKRSNKKLKDSSLHLKEKNKKSPSKTRSSPSKSHKVSSPKSRRNDEASDKRRGFSDDRKHTPKRDRSKDRDRKREVRRGRSNDDDNNGGLKKGGKILPLKPPAFNKDSGMKKDQGHCKGSEKSTDFKSKEEDNEKERTRQDREKDHGDKDKMRCEKDRLKHKKGSAEHDRKSIRERESERGSNKNKDERNRERENDRLRYAKERESERQKEREEALERCKERQRERERIEKERKEKEDKKHQRDISSSKSKNYERELPSLLDLKAENPIRITSDSGSKSSDKHILRESRKTLDKSHDKVLNVDRDGRDRKTPDLDHDRRDSRRSDENERRLGDKEFDSRRNREGDIRNSTDMRRNLAEGRRGTEDGGNSRRQWDDLRRGADSLHDRRRIIDTSGDRRQHQVGRRALDDPYKRGRGEGDHDNRDFSAEERLGRKVGHSCSEWDSKDQNVDYRNIEGREDWNHKDRHHDWNSRYDHKWLDREESRDNNWDPYPRRPPHDDWGGEWVQDQTHQIYPDEERQKKANEDLTEKNGKRNIENENNSSLEVAKENEASIAKSQEGGDALSDISDDPDDILNQDDDQAEESTENSKVQNSVHQIFIRSNEFLFEQRKPVLDGLGERSLDFEEISDEELEEEARVTKGIVDVLGADWAGLVQETRPKPKRFETAGSAHRRWIMKRLLSRLGISCKYGGQNFIDKMIEKHKNVKNENDEVNNTKESGEQEAKDEENQNSDYKSGDLEHENSSLSVPAPLEQMNEKSAVVDSENLDIKIFHPNPALHSALMKNNYVKSVIFSSHHRFKRALSARTDLSLRRKLSNFPYKEPLHFTPPMDNKLYEISMQQFQDIMPTAVV